MRTSLSKYFTLSTLLVTVGGLAGFSPDTARAVDPIPDYWTFIIPSMVPKAGQTGDPEPNNAEGLIRANYENFYEEYWKEVSYYEMNPNTGRTSQGYFNNAKTLGYYLAQWPITSREGALTGFTRFTEGTVTKPRGRGEPVWQSFGDPEPDNPSPLLVKRQLHMLDPFDFLNNEGEFTKYFDPNYEFGALIDYDSDGQPVWTPGESFFDANTNGVWDTFIPAKPATPDENFWNAQIPKPFFLNDCDEEILGNGLVFFDPTDPNQWDSERGEVFADYSGNTDLENGVVGYDQAVDIWIADNIGNTNILLTINELDLTPTAVCLDSNEGDMVHNFVDGGSTNTFTITNNIPINGRLDFPVNINGEPYISAATHSTLSNELTVAYSRWVRVSDGEPYTGPDPITNFTDFVIEEVVVPLYQAGELFNDLVNSNATRGIFGDPLFTDNDGVWTPGDPPVDAILAEKFEDYISWWDPFGGENGQGGMTYVFDISSWFLENGGYTQQSNSLSSAFFRSNPPPGQFTGDPSHNTPISREEYVAYITHNYPGDVVALLARAANGQYDGPDNWDDRGNEKYRQTAFLDASSGSPLVPASPMDNSFWDSTAFNVALGNGPGVPGTFENWWQLCFLTPAAADWGSGGIPEVAEYTADPKNQSSGWIPATTYGYDAPREFIDMPSSMYHLGGVATFATDTFIHEHFGMLRFDFETGNFFPSGDGKLGERTSPLSNSIYGEDIGPGNPNSPGGPDQFIPPAGPFAFNIHGSGGWDAGNLLNLELLTRQYRPDDPSGGYDWGTGSFSTGTVVRGTQTHLRHYRDTNLDGIIDSGETRVGEANYASDDNSASVGFNGAGTEDYPHNRQRYMEDAIEAWDNAEDFRADPFVDPDTGNPIPFYGYPIYPANTGSTGGGALGGPAGAFVSILTRDDYAEPVDFQFQARPMTGGTIGGTIEIDDIAGANYGMALLSHEQGHDIQGWADFYDYDVWNGQANPINAPVGAFDLMAGGGLVHGLADNKVNFVGGPGATWSDDSDLETLLGGAPGLGPKTLELYPVENFKDNYFKFTNPARPGEYLYVWYQHGASPYSILGEEGVIISHSDLGDDPDALPQQQRLNNHFAYEIVNADGLNQMQDGVNFGDAGDLFPGTSDVFTFSADTLPSSTWWNTQDTGLRILDIKLPAVTGDPALVTFEWYDINEPWPVPTEGADIDNDGMIDAWEFYFFGNLTTADETTDTDFDGLLDIFEFRTKLDPTDQNTGNMAMNDALRDSDGDGLPNQDEQDVFQTDPSDPDTDDDGVSDSQELDENFVAADGRKITSPVNSRSPLVERSLNLNCTPLVIPDPQIDDAYRFELEEYTIECWVKLDADQDGALIRRITVNSQTNFELRVDANVPTIQYTTESGVKYSAVAVDDIAPDTWIHLAGVYSEALATLELYINGVRAATRTTFGPPATGVGMVSGGGEETSNGVTIGDAGLSGYIDEVRIWDFAKRDTQIQFGMDLIVNTPWVTDGSFSPLNSLSGEGLVCNYRFDDGQNESIPNPIYGGAVRSFGAEDSVHPLDWDYAIRPLNNNCFEEGMVKFLYGTPDFDPPYDDQNEDGLPDWWQRLFWPDTFDPTAGASGQPWSPEANPDGDVFSNGNPINNDDEFEKDSNPLNGTDGGDEPDPEECDDPCDPDCPNYDPCDPTCPDYNPDDCENGGTGSDCPLNEPLDTNGFAWQTGALNNANNSVINSAGKFWQCESAEVLSGSFAMGAGTRPDPFNPVLGNNETAWVQTRVVGPGEVCFAYKVSSEPPTTNDPGDLLRFYINGALKASYAGEQGWATVCFDVPAGTATLRWQYEKDSFLAMGDDAAYIDNVVYTSNAGPSGICATAEPAQDAVINDARPVFKWCAEPQSTWYMITLRQNNKVIHEEWLQQTGTTWTPDFDLPCGDISWQVQPWSPSASYGDFSVPIVFTLDCCEASGIDGLAQEGAGATATVKYTWNADPCATWYQLWINDGRGKWKDTWYETGIQAGTVTKTVAGHHLGPHSWWVRGWSPTSGNGPWSNGKSFNQGKVALLSPAGSVTNPVQVSWDNNTSANATWWQIWINNQQGTFLKPWVAKAGTGVTSGLRHYTLPQSLPSGTYQVWVRGWNSADKAGPWSEESTFTVP